MSTNVGAVDFELLLNSNPFNKGLKNTTNTLKSSGIESTLGNIGKAAIAAFSVKKIVDFTKDCLDLGSNLAEVQNVVDVTFGNLNKEVDKFAQNAIEQFGLGQTVTKKYVGTFGAMAKAFDFNNQAALDMSKTLTGLTGDVASFYNLATDEAFTKLKSVFTGETESLKDLGIVMTQTALDEYALANGFGKTTAKMSEQEKTALRYQFVLEKLNVAQGDFARTSGGWANQTRVLSLRFDELKASLGQGFINLFTPIVQCINTVLGKLQVLANAFKSLTETLFGNASGDTTVSNLVTDATEASNVISSIGDSAKSSAKKMKSLAGFDTAQILQAPSSDTSSGGGGGTGNISIPSSVTDLATQTKSELNNIFDNLDYTPLLNSFNNLKESALPIIENVKNGLKWLLDNVLIPLASWTIEDVLPAFLNLVAGAFRVLNPLIEAFEPIFKWMWDNFLQPIASWTGGVIVDVINTLAEALTKVGNWMSENQSIVTSMEIAVLGFVGAWKGIELLSFLGQVGGISGALKLLTSTMWSNIAAKVADKAETVALTLMYAKDFVTSMISTTASLASQAIQWTITTGLKIADTVATGAATAATWLFNAALAVLTSPITLVIVAIGALIAIIVLIVKNWDTVSKALSDGWNWIKEKASEIFTAIGEFFKNIWNSIKETAINIWNAIKDFFINYFNTVKSIFTTVWNAIKDFFVNYFNTVKLIFTTVWNAIKDFFINYFNTVRSIFEKVWNTIKDFISNTFNGIKNTISTVLNTIKTVWTNIWNTLKNTVSNVFNGIWNCIKGIINSILGGIEGMVNGVISGINKMVNALNSIKFDVPDWVPLIRWQTIWI